MILQPPPVPAREGQQTQGPPPKRSAPKKPAYPPPGFESKAKASEKAGSKAKAPEKKKAKAKEAKSGLRPKRAVAEETIRNKVWKIQQGEKAQNHLQS